LHTNDTIDYIAVPAEIAGDFVDSFTLPDIDNGHSKTDHLCLIADFKICVVKNKTTSSCSRPLRVLRDDLADPNKVALLNAELSNIPSPDFQVGDQDHYRTIADAIARAVRRVFPRPPIVPNVPYSSPEMLEIVLERRNTRKELRLVSKFASTLADSSSFVFNATSSYLSALRSHLTSLRKSLTRLSRRDYASHVKCTAEKVSQSAFRANPSQAWFTLRYLMTLGGKCKYSRAHSLNISYHSDGSPVTSTYDKFDTLLRHFAEVEFAEITSRDQLPTDSCYSQCSLNVQTLDAANIMCPYTFRDGILRNNKSKAPGADGVNGLLCHACPDQFTRLYHPLHVKMALRCNEPSDLRGFLASAVRKKGDATGFSSDFRSVALKNYVVKHHHAFLRTRLYAIVNSSFHASQCGGIKGRGTDMASALLRWGQHTLAHYKWSSVTFFVDIKSAFYSMIRQLVTPLMVGENDTDYIVDKIGVPDVFVPALRKLMEDPSLLERYVTDPHLCAMLTASQCATWFSTIETPELAAVTRTGCCPGDPLADLLYNIALLPAIEEIQTFMVDSNFVFSSVAGHPCPTADALGLSGHGNASRHAAQVAFADDLAALAPLKVSDPNDLIPTIAALPAGVAKILLSRGMVLNTKKGKCAVLVTLVGTNAIKFKRVLANVEVIEAAGLNFFLTHCYQHLGGWIASDGAMSPEVDARCKASSANLGSFSKAVVSQTDLPVSDLANLADSLLVSTLVYNAHTWVGLNATNVKRMRSQYCKAYGTIVTNRTYKVGSMFKRVSDAVVLGEVKRLDFRVFLTTARLRFFRRILLEGSGALVALVDLGIQVDGSFHTYILDDILWLRHHSMLDDASPRPQDDFGFWVRFISGDSFKRHLNRSVSHATHFFIELAMREGMYHHICRSYSMVGCLGPPFAIEDVPAVAEEGFFCYECGHVAVDASGWHSHRRGQHDISPDYVEVASGSICPCCLTQFFTMQRVYQHFRKAHRCRAALFHFCEPLSIEERSVIDARSRAEASALKSGGQHSSFADVPCVTLLGPFRNSDWSSGLGPADFEALSIPRAQITPSGDAILADVSDIVPRTIPPELCVSAHLLTIPSLLASPVRFVLHFFSGQRRDGDFQCHFESLCVDRAVPVVVLSVDIVHHARGDLSSSKAVALWVDLILIGRVIFAFGGPPCESFSVARMRYNQDRKGPRPLRSLDSLWGIEGLTTRERAQVHIGNSLLRAMIMFICASHVAGSAIVMEHPAIPTWVVGAPSAWLLPEFLWLRNLPNAAFTMLHQCMVGAESKKPTHLFSLNCPELPVAISDLPNGGLCDGMHQHTALVGKDSSGQYRTAPAKQYPSDMNRMLARVAHRCCRTLFPHDSCSLDYLDGSIFSSFYVPFDPYNPDQVLGMFGRDFSHLSDSQPMLPVSSVVLPTVSGVEVTRTAAIAAQTDFSHITQIHAVLHGDSLGVRPKGPLRSFVSGAGAHFFSKIHAPCMRYTSATITNDPNSVGDASEPPDSDRPVNNCATLWNMLGVAPPRSSAPKSVHSGPARPPPFRPTLSTVPELVPATFSNASTGRPRGRPRKTALFDSSPAPVSSLRAPSTVAKSPSTSITCTRLRPSSYPGSSTHYGISHDRNRSATSNSDPTPLNVSDVDPSGSSIGSPVSSSCASTHRVCAPFVFSGAAAVAGRNGCSAASIEDEFGSEDEPSEGRTVAPALPSTLGRIRALSPYAAVDLGGIRNVPPGPADVPVGRSSAPGSTPVVDLSGIRNVPHGPPVFSHEGRICASVNVDSSASSGSCIDSPVPMSFASTSVGFSESTPKGVLASDFVVPIDNHNSLGGLSAAGDSHLCRSHSCSDVEPSDGRTVAPVPSDSPLCFDGLPDVAGRSVASDSVSSATRGLGPGFITVVHPHRDPPSTTLPSGASTFPPSSSSGACGGASNGPHRVGCTSSSSSGTGSGLCQSRVFGAPPPPAVKVGRPPRAKSAPDVSQPRVRRYGNPRVAHATDSSTVSSPVSVSPPLGDIRTLLGATKLNHGGPPPG